MDLTNKNNATLFCKTTRIIVKKMIPNFTLKEERKKKTAFYCSDVYKSEVDLWLALKGEPVTNPFQWNDTLRMSAGKGVEMQMLRVLKDSEIVNEDYEQKKDGRVNYERNGVEIHGYIDAITKEGYPIEIKSINNKNAFDIKGYKNGYPRASYVGQLSCYLDALGVDKGYLFVSSVDGLSYFWLECNRVERRVYQCGNVQVDLDKEYARWADIKEKVAEGIEPNWNSCRYKVPIEEIDWTKVSKDKISKARNGYAVIGDEDAWMINYSPYKKLILEKQKVEPGYSEKEIEKIKILTAGYTAKPKTNAKENNKEVSEKSSEEKQ